MGSQPGLSKLEPGLFPKIIPLSGTTSDLPDDIQHQTVRRIALVSILFGVAGLIGTVGLSLAPPVALGTRFGIGRPVPIIALATTVSLVVAFITWRAFLSVRHRITLGLIYFVVLSLFISLFRHWIPYSEDDLLRGPSPMMTLTIFIASMVPVRPRIMLFTGLCLGAMDPAGLLCTVLLGNPMPRPGFLIWLFSSAFSGAAVGYLISRVLYGLGTKVKEARLLGSYKLERRLGQGGMGEVWLARHKMLARPAAVKLIRREMLGGSNDNATSTTLQRFAREAQATAALSSPHTIQVYDFGTDRDGAFFYVMELLDGMDLKSLVEQSGPLPGPRVAYLLRQVCLSLMEAHAVGLIHRDIKPANIYVCRKGLEYDYVKVLDFGLVRELDQKTSSKLTREGVTTGTPSFMAPEVATCEHDLDARADIYALGCVAYWLLTGLDVFEGNTPLQVAVKHVNQPPVPPSERARVDVPEALEQLIMRCLEKSPEQRPHSMGAVLEHLDEHDLSLSWSSEVAEAWWHANAAQVEPSSDCSTVQELADTVPV